MAIKKHVLNMSLTRHSPQCDMHAHVSPMYLSTRVTEISKVNWLEIHLFW